MDLTIREAAFSIWDTLEQGKTLALWATTLEKPPGACRSLHDFRAYLMYAVEYPSRRRRIPMDVEAMVARWVPVIRGISTAHDKAPIDQCEFVMDEHLTPLLSAPVKQIREFYAALVVRLKADPTIPFFVWAWFESWENVMLKNAPDGDVKALKTVLATEIAEMVEKDVIPDLKSAIAGALQWRPESTLERIKTAVENGAKPRMRGRESCLFLEVVQGEDLVDRVML